MISFHLIHTSFLCVIFGTLLTDIIPLLVHCIFRVIPSLFILCFILSGASCFAMQSFLLATMSNVHWVSEITKK